MTFLVQFLFLDLSISHLPVCVFNLKFFSFAISSICIDHNNESIGLNLTQLFMFIFISSTVLNVAVGKAAMQSSTVGQGTAQKAIDGSKYPTHLLLTHSFIPEEDTEEQQ